MRSGTTLLENIFAASPEVAALEGQPGFEGHEVGEIAAEVAQHFKQRCREHLEIEVADDNPTLTDIDIMDAGLAVG